MDAGRLDPNDRSLRATSSDRSDSSLRLSTKRGESRGDGGRHLWGAGRRRIAAALFHFRFRRDFGLTVGTCHGLFGLYRRFFLAADETSGGHHQGGKARTHTGHDNFTPWRVVRKGRSQAARHEAVQLGSLPVVSLSFAFAVPSHYPGREPPLFFPPRKAAIAVLGPIWRPARTLFAGTCDHLSTAPVAFPPSHLFFKSSQHWELPS